MPKKPIDQTPILTIAVPSYNVEAYLERGLASYCDERLRGILEVIVVNDGSTDDTQRIAERFVAYEPRIFRLVNKENGGHGSAVNAGIAAATGKYFRVIDGDDWVDTENLVVLIGRLRTANADLVVDVKQEIHMQTGAKKLFPFPEYVPQDGPQDFADVCTRDDIGSFIMIHTLMIRTDYLQAVGLRLLEKTFYVDFEYVVKATLDAQSVQFVNLNVYQYLIGNANQSVADANYVKRWVDHTRVTECMLDLYEARKQQIEPARRDYLLRRCTLISNTHYNIALIFDSDRKRGMLRAKDFRAHLAQDHPEVASLTDRRFKMARMLHWFGVNSQEKLNRISKR